jgi:hypothetical protein
MFPGEASNWGGSRPLPDENGWMAVLQFEQQRMQRHGGSHGLILVQFDSSGDGPLAERAAAAIGGAIRDIDFLARIDLDTLAVLALYCDDLRVVVGRLRRTLEEAGVPSVASHIEARPAGADVQAVWAALAAGAPRTIGRRHADFSVSSPPSLN